MNVPDAFDQDSQVKPIPRAVELEGYECPASAVLAIWGMSCPTCAKRVRHGLLSWPGVHHAEINLERGLARVEYDLSRTLYGDLLDAVATAGAGGEQTFRAILLS